MKELMQKALSALAQRKPGSAEPEIHAGVGKSIDRRQGEEWDMSPEDALRVGTVARYK